MAASSSSSPASGSGGRQPLPATLAERVRFLREQQDLTPKRLAEKAVMPREQIDDIEAGLVPFLAPAVRAKLARALRVRPTVLAEAEKRPEPEPGNVEARHETLAELLQAIVARPERRYFCPDCGAALRIRRFERRDLDDRPVGVLKIDCTRCLFTLGGDHG